MPHEPGFVQSELKSIFLNVDVQATQHVETFDLKVFTSFDLIQFIKNQFSIDRQTWMKEKEEKSL